MNDLNLKRNWKWKTIIWRLAVVGGGLLVIAAACLDDLKGKPAETWMSQRPDACRCIGTTLHCGGTEVGATFTEDFTDSPFCDPDTLNEANVCYCVGSDLTCFFTYQSDTGTPPGGLATPDINTPYPTANLTFEDYPACLLSSQVTASPISVENGAQECSTSWYPESGCTCCGTDLRCFDGTSVQNHPACFDTPPEQCSTSWLPKEGCTCCGTTMVCYDGTHVQSHPACSDNPPEQCSTSWLPASGCRCCGTDLVCYNGKHYQSHPACFPDPPEQCGDGWLPESGCACCGTDLICYDGKKIGNHPACTVNGGAGGGNTSGGSSQGGAPEVCASGWLPDAGCTCCGTTLVCADGNIGEFNSQCTGSGVEPTACPVGAVCP